jgi:hypothetical protein
MKSNKILIPMYTLITIFFILFAGCAAGQTSLVKNGTVQLISKSSDEIDILFADLHQEKNKIVITGKVKPHKKFGNFSSYGNVDIKFSDSKGIIYKSAKVHVHFPRNHVRKNKETYFKLSENIAIKKGSIVYISINSN